MKLKMTNESSEFDVNSVKDSSKISLNIGYGLVSLVSKDNEDSLVPSITKLRKEISKNWVLLYLVFVFEMTLSLSRRNIKSRLVKKL